MKKAIFAGSFDPVHPGHLKIIQKAAKLFDKLYVVVANNNFKNQQKNIQKRKQEIIKQIAIKNVEVEILEEKYLAKWAEAKKINYLVRSARNDIDFNYELEMAKMNKIINQKLETILIIPNYDDIHFSSTQFREFNKQFKIEKESK